MYFLAPSVATALCCRLSKRSEKTLMESELALKLTELLLIKIDTLRLQIMRYLKKFVFTPKKIDL